MIRSVATALLPVVALGMSTLPARAQSHARVAPQARYARATRINAGTTFSPTSIPNLNVWLDAADASSLVQSNGKVSQWTDKSGRGNTVTQTAGSAQPTVVNGALNGNANVAFDGAASYLLSAASFTQSVYPASTTFIVASGTNTSVTESALWNGGNVAGYPRWAYGIPSGSNSQVKFFFGGQNDQLLYPTSINVSSPAIYDGGESVTTQQGFINYNGAAEASIAGNITGDTGSYPLSVGARYQPSPVQVNGYYKGKIAEVLVYGALLSTAQVQQIEGYLACKWGLQGSLPASHPYRNSCSGGGTPPPTTVDVDTYHNDNLRTGWNSNETTLTPSNVSTSSFKQIMNLAVDGLTFTQPLVATNVAMGGSSARNLVISGTNNDTLYAFDADNGGTVWKRSFISPPNVTTAGISFTGCDNTGQQDGLLSTPVIDRATDTLYVVATTMEPHHMHFRLHALALSTGQDKMSNVEILGSAGGTAFTADVQFQRPALLKSGGNIYIGFGSQCDFKESQYHGWVFAYNASNLAQTGVFNTTPSPQNSKYAGGVWMSGEGLSADASGNIFFATGNGTFDGGAKNFGESVLRLQSNLSSSSLSFFTPSTYFSDNTNDKDFGSGGVMLLPDQPFGTPHLAVAQGKDGILTLLNRDNLGGYHAGGPDNALAELNVGGVWAAPAYWKDSSGNPYVLTTGGSGPLRKVKVGSASLTNVGQTSVGFPSDNGGGSYPSVSSNGTNDGTAIVWIVQRVKDAHAPAGSGGSNVLYAFPASNLGTTLFSASLGGWPQNDLNPTLVPTIANGKVYVPTQNSIAVFGLQ